MDAGDRNYCKELINALQRRRNVYFYPQFVTKGCRDPCIRYPTVSYKPVENVSSVKVSFNDLIFMNLFIILLNNFNSLPKSSLNLPGLRDVYRFLIYQI